MPTFYNLVASIKNVQNMRFSLFLFIVLLGAAPAISSEKMKIALAVEAHIDQTAQQLPPIQSLFNENIRDISVLRGPGGIYYLTGSTGDIDGIQNGIQVWQSTDLKNWLQIGSDGYVWNIDRDGKTWHKEVTIQNGVRRRAAFSPELFFFNDTFWLTYSMSNSNSSGLLRSITGSANGPYEDVSEDKPLVKGINATLFRDTDGTLWYIWDNGKMRKLKSDLSGFDGLTIDMLIYGNRLNSNHIQLIHYNGEYLLTSSRWHGNGAKRGHAMRSESQLQLDPDAHFDAVFYTGSSPTGPFRETGLAVPHAGGGMLFEDFEKKLWLTLSGNNDASAPFRHDAAMLAVKQTVSSGIEVEHAYAMHPGTDSKIVYVSTLGNDNGGGSWVNAFTTVQAAIAVAKPGDQVWIAAGNYTGSVEINNRSGLYIYGGFKGNETALNQRDPEKNKSVLDGKYRVFHTIFISGSRYVRLDGLTITGGRANGRNFYDQYGGGVYLLGGGETIRLVQCTIEANASDLDGAGVYCSMGASPLLIGCTIQKNGAGRNGGGIAFYGNLHNGYHLQLYNCEISQNQAKQDGGALYFDTDLKRTGLLRAINCIVAQNTTGQDGGAITLERASNLFLSNCTVAENRGTENGASALTVGHTPAHARIENTLFYKNEGGTLIQGYGENAGIKNGQAIDEKWMFVKNCLFFQNKGNALYKRLSTNQLWKTVDELNSSPFAEQNTARDPILADPALLNYRLKSGSAAINAGSSQTAFPLDKDGKSRTLGSAESNQIEIGAYEF
jgi:xylan 1,4-beta-xylosidase